MFDPEPREILHAIVILKGISITHQPKLLENILEITCPDSAVEIQLLLDALNENIADEIVSPVSVMLPRDQMIKEQSVRISHALAASKDTSKWIVESWDYIINGRAPSDGMADAKPEYANIAQSALAEVMLHHTEQSAPANPIFVFEPAPVAPVYVNPSATYFHAPAVSPMPIRTNQTISGVPVSGMPMQQPVYNPADPSLYGQPPPLPVEGIDIQAGKWNWGAFFLSFLWLINHGQPGWGATLLLTNFIPKIGPILYFAGSIFCGLKGNELAWQFRSYNSSNEFKDAQRIWAFIGAITWGILLTFTIVCFIIKFSRH